MIIGSLLAAPLSDKAGRKVAIILGVGVTYLISYTLFVFPVNLLLLYLARMMHGAGVGVSTSISTLYIAEVSTPSKRASLAVIPAMTGCLGVNACQVTISGASYQHQCPWESHIKVYLFILLDLIWDLSVVYIDTSHPPYLVSNLQNNGFK